MARLRYNSPAHKQAQIIRGLKKQVDSLEQDREVEGRVDVSRIVTDTAITAVTIETEISSGSEHDFVWDETDNVGWDMSMIRGDDHERGTTTAITAPDTAVHYWTLNEGSGSTVEDIVGDADGTINGATWANLPGGGNYALDFDGGTDYVDTPYVPSDTELGGTGGALEAWIYWRQFNERQYIGTWGAPRFYLGLRADSGDRQVGYGDDWTQFGTVPSEGWEHYVISNDGSTTEVYANNTEITTFNSSFTGTHTENFHIGNVGGTDYPVDGLIGEVCIHDEYLDASDVDDRYNERAHAYI